MAENIGIGDFSKGFAPNFSGNSGSSVAGLTNGNQELFKKINESGQERVRTDYVTQSDTTSGFNSSQTGSSGTQQGPPELERVYTDFNKKPEVVGTNINDKNPVGDAPESIFQGFRSIINPYHLVRYHSLMKSNGEKPPQLTQLGVPNDEINYKGLADSEAYKNPSTSLIINHYNKSAQYERKYAYSDFLYMKHYHPFNNNRLITLRRFMIPVYDECRVALKNADAKLRRPIAQALNYLDVSGNSLNTLTKMNVGIPTTSITGAGQDGKGSAITLQEADDVLGLGGSIGDAGKAGLKILSLLSGQEGTENFDKFQQWTSAYDPWSNGPLQDLVYGPVNVITGAEVRARGLTFGHTQELKIVFEYSSKTIEHFNQKAVMLDILSNMLALTYNHAQFWGGENRFLIDRKNFPLVRAEVMYQFLQDVNNNKNLQKTTTGIAQSASSIVENMKNFANSFSKGSIDGLFTENNLKSLQSVLTQYMFLDNAKLKEYQKTILERTKAELTGAPTGEWHLQVGNPFAPIMMIGNLWCTKCDFEFNNELSIDDFPTELKYTCTLKPGMGRDSSAIQSIFNTGGGSVYYNQSNDIDVNASSSTGNSEMAVRNKSDEILGSTNRFSVDRAGNKISELVKKPESVIANNSYATSLFRPIKTLK